MKGLFGLGAPKRRISMQFGYDIRPSFWQELKANSHLVIAAVGTAALLGIAGTALWLALPSSERQAFADPKPQVQAETGAEPRAETVDADAVAADDAPAAAESTISSKVAPKADAVRPPAAAEADIPALPLNDPRWTGTGKPAAATVAVKKPDDEAGKTAFAEEKASGQADDAGEEQAADATDGKVAASEQAEAHEAAHADPDANAATAAIPAVRPVKPVGEPAANGSILRAVTMRSGPKKGAAAIGTIPARAAVQVMSCKSWCEVVYKGKHGFIYKSFVQRDG